MFCHWKINIIAGGYKYYFPCKAALFLVHTMCNFGFLFKFPKFPKKIIDKIAKSQHMIQVGNQVFFFFFPFTFFE
jgi:hypothetical protein